MWHNAMRGALLLAIVPLLGVCVWAASSNNGSTHVHAHGTSGGSTGKGGHR